MSDRVQDADPRVLTPDSDEPDVMITTGSFSSDAYHPLPCSRVRQAKSTRSVKRSVARWKGYDRCDICRRLLDEDDGEHPASGPHGSSPAQRARGIGSVACIEIRCRLLAGLSHRDLHDSLGTAPSTSKRHARGECSCTHDAPRVHYESREYYAADPPNTRVTARACDDIRGVLCREGVTTDALGQLFDVSPETIRDHARGECAHDVNTAALTFDRSTDEWVRATEVNTHE